MKKQIEEFLNYAVKEGFINDDISEWTDEQKESYYNRCMVYESEVLEE